MKLKNIFFVIIGIASFVFALILPARHDYVAYIKQWQAIRDGLDPYIQTGNAYGITYNYFAYLNFSKILHIPRAIFVISYLYAAYLLSKCAIKKDIKHSSWIPLCLICNPLFLFFSLKYGSNDSFLAAITIIGLILIQKKQNILAGIIFAIAVCFKFTPIFVLPFFMISKMKYNFKLIASFLTSFLFIYLIGFITWGKNILAPFLFGAKRKSSVFSVFRYIRGEYQPLEFLGIDTLDYYSVFCVGGAVFIIFIFYYIFNLDALLCSLLSFSTLLLFYKVGHHQFYILFLMYTIFIFIEKHSIMNKSLLIHFMIFFSWIFFHTIIFDFAFGHFINWIEWLGLPTFLIHLSLNISLIKVIIHQKNNYPVEKIKSNLYNKITPVTNL